MLIAPEAPATNANAAQISSASAAPVTTPNTSSVAPDPERAAFDKSMAAAGMGANGLPIVAKEPFKKSDPKNPPAAVGTDNANVSPTDGQANDAAASDKDETDGKLAAPEFATASQRAAKVDATRALRRDGWTDEEIAELPPSKLLTIGERRAAAQAKTDARFKALQGDRLGTPNRELIADDDLSDLDPTNGNERGSTGLEPSDLDELLDEIADPARSETIRKSMSAAEQRAAQAEAKLLTANLRFSIDKLTAEFPKLGNEADRRRVLLRMDKLDPQRTSAGDLESMLQLMKDAAYIVFGAEIQAQARRAATDTANRHLDGQPDLNSDNAKPEKRLTADEFERAAFEASTGGRTREESQREMKRRIGKSTG